MEYKMTENNEKKLNIYQKLHAVTESVESILKESNEGMPYKIVTHNTVTQAVKDKITEHRLWINPIVEDSSNQVDFHHVIMKAEIIDIDNPVDKVVIGSFPAIGIDKQDKGFGKAISYAYKYILQKAFMMNIDDAEEVELHEEEKTPVDYEDLAIDFRYFNKNEVAIFTTDDAKVYQKKLKNLTYWFTDKNDFKNMPTLKGNHQELLRIQKKLKAMENTEVNFQTLKAVEQAITLINLDPKIVE
tara:strand:+ start:3433 stop:4164 length:732 start_codon:yes stop_codon:yes gene_type:complete